MARIIGRVVNFTRRRPISVFNRTSCHHSNLIPSLRDKKNVNVSLKYFEIFRRSIESIQMNRSRSRFIAWTKGFRWDGADVERVIAVAGNTSITLYASVPDWEVPQRLQIPVLDEQFMNAFGQLGEKHLDWFSAKALVELKNLLAEASFATLLD